MLAHLKNMEFEITLKFEPAIKIFFLQFCHWPIPYRISTWTGNWTSKHVVRKVNVKAFRQNSNYWPKRSGNGRPELDIFLKKFFITLLTIRPTIKIDFNCDYEGIGMSHNVGHTSNWPVALLTRTTTRISVPSFFSRFLQTHVIRGPVRYYSDKKGCWRCTIMVKTYFSNFNWPH